MSDESVGRRAFLKNAAGVLGSAGMLGDFQRLLSQ